MKTNRLTTLAIAALGLAAFPAAGWAEKDKTVEASMPPAKDASSNPAAPAPIQIATAASPDAAQARWSDIKDISYDARVQFFAGLTRLEARLDGQIRELTAKRATMNSATVTKDWDFAMKEMEDARTHLKSMGESLSKVSAETWEQEKEKVGLAWTRAEDAYDKVKSSTTG